MRKAFKQIPEPLQRQILCRLLSGFAVLVVTTAFVLSSLDILSALTCAAIMVFCAISAFLLFRRAVAGDYVVISGDCIGVALTAFRKRTKMITLRTEDDRPLQVIIRQRNKKISVGSRVTLYIAANMLIYEKGGGHILHSYLAIEAK
jgi:hypothetical protein